MREYYCGILIMRWPQKWQVNYSHTTIFLLRYIQYLDCCSNLRSKSIGDGCFVCHYESTSFLDGLKRQCTITHNDQQCIILIMDSELNTLLVPLTLSLHSNIYINTSWDIQVYEQFKMVNLITYYHDKIQWIEYGYSNMSVLITATTSYIEDSLAVPRQDGDQINDFAGDVELLPCQVCHLPQHMYLCPPSYQCHILPCKAHNGKPSK